MADGRPEANPIGYFDTLLRYYLGVDPDSLSDQQWAQMLAQLRHIRQSESTPSRR